MREHHRAIRRAGVDVQRQGIPAAEDVVLADPGRQHEFVGRPIPHPQVHHARRLLLHVHIHVDLIGRTRHGLRLDIDVGEIAQAIDAVLGGLDAGRVVPGSFLLAHFTAHHGIPGARIAADVDAAHIDAPPRIDVEGQAGDVMLAVQHGIRIDVGKRIAQRPQVIRDRLGHRIGLLGGKGLPFFHRHQWLELVFEAQQVACEVHLAQLVGLTLMHRERDVDGLAIRRDGDLRRFHGKFQVAAVQVVRADALHVAFELFTRILVGAGVPGHDAAGGQLHLVFQRAGQEGLVADEFNLGDRGHFAFENIEAHANAVARQRRDHRIDLHAVLALGQILLLDFEGRPIQHRLVEHPPLAESHARQGRGDRLDVEFAHAVEGDGRDGRAFFHGHNQHITARIDLDVTEKTRAIELLNGRRRLVFSKCFADFDWQIGKDSTGIDAFQPLNLNVMHHERREGRRHRRGRQHQRNSVLGQTKLPRR
ncbi:hypothetical protein CDEF62S_01471 [Castellaniella defragrans]